MNYDLNSLTEAQKNNTAKALRKLVRWLGEERRVLIYAFITMMITSGINLTGPLVIGYTIDHYVATGNSSAVITNCFVLLGLYALSFSTNYLQTRLMGGVGQRILFNLRNGLFTKLNQLPLAFFNQNRTGDLISRINNDTDKVNQFFSQSLMQFVTNIFMMLGSAIFLIAINPRLGAAALVPAVLILLFIRVISPLVKKRNARNLKSGGAMSAEIQESLQNFKAIIAFNRRDYFRQRFNEASTDNYKSAIGAGLVNNIFLPVFTFCSHLAQLTVLIYGIFLITHGMLTVGILISYFAYVSNFYFPIRQLATIWTSFQVAMAGWDRIAVILDLEPAKARPALDAKASPNTLLSFQHVHFGYPGGEKEVLHNVSFELQRGKTYAFVGPTGGGKSTTASLMAGLYNPTGGTVLLKGKDMQVYDGEQRTESIGFILQEPFLFSGTVKDNILYGNKKYAHLSNEGLEKVIKEARLEGLLEKFEGGLESNVSDADSVSLGQKQLIAFMRAVLRHPELLILDEATANIDTLTENLLEDILEHLPDTTTRVIIAHRLNTIESADEIFFVNDGRISRAGNFQEALAMLMQEARVS
ncbi:ABC transporter ATP-binding protein [Danxiaibacter flavus]|uniref:ABC transporter ATP-binding protein n=1 Tax=Danxiaibacter flavus TaxID=3049108 RepID=A0ABV3ZH03_9BACT|nr:ABC transporter ATP-binding protein [Chitinophagaceae bacterium DXS]